MILMVLSAESRKKLESIVSKTMSRAHIAGVSLALLEDGEVVYAEGF